MPGGPLESSSDVVIAGAGPVGCVLALLLARAGIRVVILEAQSSLIQDLRASTFHPPTLDLLDELEISQRLIELGLITPLLQYRDLHDGLIAQFDHALLQGLTNHPYRLQCEQFKLTAVTTALLADYDEVSLHFNSRVLRVEQDENGATVHYHGCDGNAALRCHYVIGCDGSRSAVRKSIGIEFAGFTYPEHFVTASVREAIDDIVPGVGHVAYIADPDEWCVLIHAPEYWRFLFPIPVDFTQQQALDEAYLQRRLQALAPYDGAYTIGHRTLYAVNQRVAKSYRNGRALLAGDAAHVNNPVGGMGMNGGLHDAFNLAEKLVDVLRKNATADTLDAYDAQRRPVAIEYVQRQSIHNKKVIETRDPVLRRRRQQELRAIAADRERSIELLKQTSMINALRRN